MNINFSRRVPTCGSSSDGWHRLVIVRLVVSLGLCALMLPATLSTRQVRARPASLSREAPADAEPAVLAPRPLNPGARGFYRPG